MAEMDRRMLEPWVRQSSVALDRLERTHVTLEKGLERAAWAARVVTGMLAVTVLGTVAAVFLQLHFDPGAMALVIAVLALARGATLRRIRDYENRLALLAELDVHLSAAITMRRPEVIDRSMKALTAAQTAGVLSTRASGHFASRRAFGLVANLLRPLIK